MIVISGWNSGDIDLPNQPDCGHCSSHHANWPRTTFSPVIISSNEFLDVALIADEGSRSAVLFDAQVVEKGWQHFRDQWRWRIRNVMVCVLLCNRCMIMVVHTAIVGDAGQGAKREERAESSNACTLQCDDATPVHG